MASLPKHHRYVRTVLLSLAVFFFYAATGWLGLRLNPVSGFATLVWPPTGIALIALMIFGEELWPGVFLGALVVNFITGASLPVALGIAVGNTLEPVIATIALKRMGFHLSLDRLKDVLALILLGGIVGPSIAATIGSLSLLAGGIVSSGASFLLTWRAWWLGDALGALLLAPLIFSWFSDRRKFNLASVRFLEAALMFSACAALGVEVFGPGLGGPSAGPSFVYLMLLPLIWAAIRFHPRETLLGLFLLSAIAIAGTVEGYGPFARSTISEGLLFLQIFMWISVATSMVLASSVEERRHIEEELKKSNDGLRREAERLGIEMSRSETLLASIGEGVIAVDQDARVSAMNRAAELMLGLASEKARGRSVFEVAPMFDEKGRLAPTERQPLHLSLESGKTVTTPMTSNDYFMDGQGARFPISVTASALVPEKDVRGAVMVFRDITAEKKVAQSKTEFVSMTAHQLRTPLTSARWSLELLLSSRKELSKEQKENVEEIYASIIRMAELVNDLLNIARIERGEFTLARENVDLLEVVRKIVGEYKLQLKEKDILLEQRLPERLPTVMTDPQMIAIAIEDVVSNAIKYNAKGGRVEISLAEKRAGESLDGRRARQDGVLAVIADNGYGIPKHQQHQIFNKFFRASNAMEHDVYGTGFGLYIAKVIVDYSGGEIWFDSEEGKGTTFYLFLPLRQPDA